MPSIATQVRQQEILQPGRITLRHVAPLASGPDSPGIQAPLDSSIAVLNQALYGAKLPISRLPDSPDFTDGSYTVRLLDAGDFTLTFPNKDASDGQPWRSRFSAEGHNEFVEIGREDATDFVGVITKVVPDRQKVTVSGYDGQFLLKKAYVQEYNGVIGPRDAIELFSQLPVFKSLQNFAGGLPAGWGSSGTITYPGEGAHMALPTTSTVTLHGPTHLSGTVGSRWQARADLEVTGGIPQALVIEMQLRNSAKEMRVEVFRNNEGDEIFISKSASQTNQVQFAEPNPLKPGTHTLLLDCDGRWISGYIDGQLIAVLPVYEPEALPEVLISVFNSSATKAASVVVSQFMVRELEPFLLGRSPLLGLAGKGEAVLPGSADTYPYGGLHGRWYQSPEPEAAAWYQTVLAPDPRRPGFPNFIENQQETLQQIGTLAGVGVDHYAFRLFGAVYLDLEHNTEVAFTVKLNGTSAVRLWVGDTRMGQQIIDSWTMAASRELTGSATVGHLQVQRAGWYPIVLEYATSVQASAVTLDMKAATGWTDPGGTVIPSGTLVDPIPATSVSPLGCVDARYQGSSHFDIVQEVAKAFGYQYRASMASLESGQFPCQILPVSRTGRDTDEIIEPDDVDRHAGINNYSASNDAVDSVTSLRGFGSGIADGKGSQVAYEAISIADAESSLFDMQGWLGANDIAFPALLQAMVEAQLAVRLGVWQNIEGEPLARDRLADQFPLTGKVSQFLWLPGDGVRLWLPDVGIRDLTPRQLMQVTRSFAAEGRYNTSVGFRPRPKDAVYALRQAIREATRPARSYQKAALTRPGSFVQSNVANGAVSGPSIVSLTATDKVLSAIVHVSLVLPAATPFHLNINGADVTTALGGPWNRPVSIDVTRYAKAENRQTGRRLYAQINNQSGVTLTEIDHELVLTLVG